MDAVFRGLPKLTRAPTNIIRWENLGTHNKVVNIYLSTSHNTQHSMERTVFFILPEFYIYELEGGDSKMKSYLIQPIATLSITPCLHITITNCCIECVRPALLLLFLPIVPVILLIAAEHWAPIKYSCHHLPRSNIRKLRQTHQTTSLTYYYVPDI